MEPVFLVILLPVIDFLPKYELLTAEGKCTGAILVEQNDEWAVQRARYMTLQSIAQTSDNVSIKLLAPAASQSRPCPPETE